jgi:hypothetical protein
MNAKGFDLSKLDTVAGANAGFGLDIMHPSTGENLGITITLLGKDSDEFQRVSRAQSKRRIEKTRRGMRGPVVTQEEVDQDGIELLAACTTGWTGVVMSGKEVPFSRSEAEKLYREFPWMREQIDVAIGDRSNFIKG